MTNISCVYLVVMYDNCGDAYNDVAFITKEDAIEYAYQQIKNEERLKEWYFEEELEDISYQQYVKNMLEEEGYIDELVQIDRVDVVDIN